MDLAARILTSVDPVYGTDMGGTVGNMGMEYNPNTNMICWNSHLEVLIGSYITFAYYYEINPATGEFTRYNDFWHEMGGLIIPVRSGGSNSWADPTDKVMGVKLNREQISVIRGTTAQLTANVQPWTATDRTVTWTSADESVAMVDSRGVVTGIQEGTTTIRATSNLDPSFYAECVVTVEILDVTVHGTLTDAENNSMFYDWDMSTGESWTAGAALHQTMTSATYSSLLDAFYMMDNVSNKWEMHKVGADGQVLESAPNPNAIPLWDMSYSAYFSQQHGREQIVATYYYYLLSPKDPMAMDAVGFNLGDMANYLVGITSMGYEQMEDEDGNVYDTEHLILLDDDGYIWDFWIYDVPDGGMNALYNITKSNLTCEFLGDDTMENMYTSLMVGEDNNLYLSTYTGATNELYYIAYDAVEGKYMGVKIGEFGENVWPATITSVTVNSEITAQGGQHPAPAYTMSATTITGSELAAASVSGNASKDGFVVTEQERDEKYNIIYANSVSMELGKNNLESGALYTYTVPADGRLEFAVGSVYDGNGNKVYSWYNGSRLRILINGKPMTSSTAKFNVTAGQVVNVVLESLDGNTYTTDLTIRETTPAETMNLGSNALSQDLEYVFTATKQGTVYVSVVEMLYNGEPTTESSLGSSIQMTINGASVSTFNKSYEVKVGDEIAIVLMDFSWDGSGTVSAVIDLSYDGFYEHPLGSLNNPVDLLLSDCPTESIELAAGTAAWYRLESYYDNSSWSTVYPFDGKYLVVTGENAYVIVEGTRYDAVDGVVKVLMDDEEMIQIGNGGDTAAIFAISVEIPEGHKDNPQDLQEGNNTVTVPSYGSHYFDYTADVDGTLTVTVSGENWKYNFAHYDANGEKISSKDYYFKNGDSDTVSVEIKTGETIVVIVGTSKGYTQPGGEITVNLQFQVFEPACDHANIELRDAKNATCTEPGYTGDTYCADCGELISAGETIAAPGHSYVEGICQVCGAEDPDYVPENQVTVNITADVLATNGIFVVTWDAENMTLKDMVIFTDYFSVVEGEGMLTVGYICMNGIAAGEVIASLTFEAVDPTVAAVAVTHKEVNNEHVCGHANTELRDVKEATCTEPGYTGDLYCADCGKLVESGEATEAIGHSYVDGICQHCGEADPSATVAGDANADGVVNYLDAMLIAQYYVGDIGEDALNVAAADVNGDGTVNYLDAMMVAQYYVGDIHSFPTEN